MQPLITGDKMKKLIFVTTALLFACSSDQGVNWLRGSFTDALETARTENKPILVDFYSDT